MKYHQISKALCFIALGVLLAAMQIDNEKLTEKVQAIQVQFDDHNLHSKEPCMTIPDGSPCQDKTVFFKLPGGSHRKEIRRICAWKSPVAQEWKDEE